MLTKKPPILPLQQKKRPKQAVYCDYFHSLERKKLRKKQLFFKISQTLDNYLYLIGKENAERF
jgi:hypothetical protein